MKYTNEDADDWDQYIQSVAFAYRVNVQATTKFSPFELLYGVKARLPLDMEGKGDVEPDDDETLHNRLVELASSLKEKRQEAKKNIETAQAKQKHRYDLKHKAPVYKVGDMVLRYNRRRDTRVGDKLSSRFTGPFKIVEVMGRGVYRLQQGGKPVKQIVNATNLKLWHQPTSPASSPRSSPSETPLAQSPKTHTRQPKRSLSSSSSSDTAPSSASTLSYTAAPSTNSVVWIPDLNLFEEDRLIITGRSWLNDRLMDAVNVLVGRHLGGNLNQSTLLAQGAGGFVPVQHESIQILYDRDHWIASAYIGGHVLYADSLGRGVSVLIARQLRQLYAIQIGSDGRLEVQLIPCQTQPNSDDCGLFASAFAMEWALGNTIEGITYAVPRMRQHLLECLEMGSIQGFPRLHTNKKGRNEQSRTVYV